jgi:uridylate kinase
MRDPPSDKTYIFCITIYFLVVGGALSRELQAAARSLGVVSKSQLDVLGIYGTKTHAELLRLAFGHLAEATIVQNPNRRSRFTKKILVAGGWTPGRSSDDVAVRLAKTYGSKMVINLSNIDYVYDKDPRSNNKARPFTHLTWKEFRSLLAKNWKPGQHVPFDPIASKDAELAGQSAIVINGRKLKNLDKVLLGKPFIGTVIV